MTYGHRRLRGRIGPNTPSALGVVCSSARRGRVRLSGFAGVEWLEISQSERLLVLLASPDHLWS
jgi:hypothetical protein